MQLLRQQDYYQGAKAVAPLAVAIGAIGIVFGYTATRAGFSPLAAVVMSATTFAGSAQFAAVAIIGAGGPLSAAVSSALLLNARYVPMGAAIGPELRGRFWKRALVAQFVVDETWAIAYLGGGRFSTQRLVGSGLVLLATHVSATAVGAGVGTTIGDPAAWGLDAAFPALFVILLRPHVRKPTGIVAALLGASIALALTPLTPPGIPIVGAAVASLVGGNRQ